MKKTCYLLGVLAALIPATISAAQTAQARIYCLSPRFSQSHDSSGHDYRLNLSSFSSSNNGELSPGYFSDPRSHGAFVELYDDLWESYFYGIVDLDVPDDVDANANGYPDFFEVSQPGSGSSSGSYNIGGIGTGSVTASWVREAGSHSGSCYLVFNDLYFDDVLFIPAFEVLEYSGPLTYTPGSNTVAGAVSLVQAGNEANTLQGAANFVKTTTNRFNVLNLQAGGWTNAYEQTWNFPVQTFRRFQTVGTNYYGYVVFADGEPNTGGADYQYWELSIDDLNDSDHDGIPDFSDDPSAAAPPRRPVLTLTRGTTNLFLKISGDVGRTNSVQEINSLAATNWTTISTFTVTNDPQTVSLPLPSAPKFWRVRVH